MKYRITFIHGDGRNENLKEFACCDLDYWNIRQWRLLLYTFYQIHIKSFGSLLITPIKD